jgi:predicted nucleotidyltransferase
MNFNVNSRLILKIKHGSHAYGLNVEGSDLDVKGICIPPKEYYFGFAKNFDQHIEESSKGYPEDLVIYSLSKFAKLASECNPNIIECLYGDDEDILFINEYGEALRSFRDNFLSLKARYTFAGFAHSQLKRIKTHRNWLLNPPKQPPSRKEFGLSDQHKVSKSELGAFDALMDKQQFADLSNEALSLFSRERAYKNMATQWEQYQNWKATRNPVRAAMEAESGFDRKHGSHLIRLLRMCHEIMDLGKVIVRRPDREELLAIKNGQVSYEALIQEAEELEAKCAVLYETSQALPKHPDINKIDAFVVDLTERYLSEHG